MPKFASNIDMWGLRVTNMAEPTSDTDAATRNYVYDQVNKNPFKKACRLASTANINISNPGTSTFDSTTAVSGDRILLKDQTDQTQNGPYVFNGSASAMTRVDEVNTSAEITPGMVIPITEGTLYHDTLFLLTTNAPYTLGTTGLTFTQFPIVTTDSYTTTIAAATSNTVTHNLGTRLLLVRIYHSTTPWEDVICDISMPDTNTITVGMDSTITGSYVVVIKKM